MYVLERGLNSIANVASKLVPFMGLFYIGGCLIILVVNADVLGQAVAVICQSAFTARSATGGFVGSSVALVCRYGFARGLFSNESGMGPVPLAAAAAQTRNPKRQAMITMTATFWDTVVMCLLSGLVFVSCIIKYPEINGLSGNGALLTSQAFGMIPYAGVPVLAVYWKRDELTKAAFTECPILPGHVMYHTRDLGRYNCAMRSLCTLQ